MLGGVSKILTIFSVILIVSSASAAYFFFPFLIIVYNKYFSFFTGAYDRREDKMLFSDMDSDDMFPEYGDNEDMSGDGWGWIDEIWRYGMNPWFKDRMNLDTDGDGLTNLDEADVYGTDPLSPDTDD